MAKINDNDILFDQPLDVKRGVKGRIQNLNNSFSDTDSIVDVEPFVNAVEIDWNGAQIGEG